MGDAVRGRVFMFPGREIRRQAERLEEGQGRAQKGKKRMIYKADLADEEEIAEDLRGIRDSLGRLKRKWKGRLEGHEGADEEDRQDMYDVVSEGIDAVDDAIGYIDSAMEVVENDLEGCECTIQEADFRLRKRRNGER